MSDSHVGHYGKARRGLREAIESLNLGIINTIPSEGLTIYSKLIDRLQQIKAPHTRILDRDRNSTAKRSAFWVNHPRLVYVLVLSFLSAVLVFSLIGISVAQESANNLRHIWIPRLLAIASGFLMATTLYRLIRRIFR